MGTPQSIPAFTRFSNFFGTPIPKIMWKTEVFIRSNAFTNRFHCRQQLWRCRFWLVALASLFSTRSIHVNMIHIHFSSKKLNMSWMDWNNWAWRWARQFPLVVRPIVPFFSAYIFKLWRWSYRVEPGTMVIPVSIFSQSVCSFYFSFPIPGHAGCASIETSTSQGHFQKKRVDGSTRFFLFGCWSAKKI